MHGFLWHTLQNIPISLATLPAAILHFICFSYLLSAVSPLCDLVLLSPLDFLPLLRWQGDGLSPNKLVHLSIRGSVEEVPAIMKLSGRLQLREWWREEEEKRLNYGILCEDRGNKTEMSSRCQHICRRTILGDGAPSAAISVVLWSMNNHPPSLSTRHHQPSLNFNTAFLFTDLLFFLSIFPWMVEFILGSLLIVYTRSRIWHMGNIHLAE